MSLETILLVSALVGVLIGGSVVYTLDRWRSPERKILEHMLELID